MAESKSGNTALRRLRVDLKYTQEEIVDALTVCADRMRASGRLSRRVDLSVRQYCKWESATPPWPRPDTRAVLEEFFKRPVTELGFTSPYEQAQTEVVPLVVRSPDDHEVPRSPLSGPADQGLPWLMSPGLGGGTSEWRIGEAEVHLLRAAADDMDAIDQQFGGNRLWRPTRAHLLWVHQMIDRGIYGENLGRQLHTVAGKFTTSLGWFCYDAGLQAEARYYFSEALNTANFTGDDALASRTLSNMARQAVDLNKGREAVRFARLAQAHAAEWSAPHRVTALLAIREAQGYARLGDRFSCEASIRCAWQEWERGQDDRDPDWTGFLNEAELVCLEGMCRLDLDQNDSAQNLLTRSERLQDVAHSRNRAMCLGRLSVAALKNRDLGHCVDAATESLRLITSGMSSQRSAQQLKIVQSGLEPHHRNRDVRGLLEQMRERIA